MKSSKGMIILWTIVGLAAFISLAFATKTIIDSNNKYNDYDFNSVIAASEENGNIGDHVKGDPDAPVKIFEYADYQCPGCSSINPRVKKIIEELDGKLAIVYRSYILPYHDNGTAAAAAAEAAGLQGYWEEYGDLLFEKQSEWEGASPSERTKYFEQYFQEVAGEKGDLAKFSADIKSSDVTKKINFDMGIGKRINIEATPAFFIDGQYIRWNESGEVTVNGEKIAWESSQGGEKFSDLIKRIVNAKLK